jgi:hypothetical protein
MNRLTLLAIFSVVIAAFSTTELQAAQVLFTPQLTLGEKYSDNILLAPSNEEHDFITTIGLGLTGQLLWRTAGLQLNYNPSYSMFADHSDFNYWRHAANLHGWKDLTREIRLDINDDYLQTSDPRDNTAQYATTGNLLQGPAIPTDIYRRGIRKYWQNVAEARLTHQFGIRDMYFLAVQNYILRDIQTPVNANASDYTIWQPSAGLDYWFGPFWGLETRLYYAHQDYVSNVDREKYNGTLRLLRKITHALSGFVQYRQTALYYAQPTLNDYQIYSPSAGLQYQFEKNAYISIGGGYYIQNVKNAGNKESWLATSEIYKRWAFRSGYVDLTGGSGYDIHDTGTQVLGLDIYYNGRLDLNYNFTQRFSALAYGSYSYDKYPNQVPERIDRLVSAGAGLNYQALRWMNVALKYDFNKFISDVKSQEYKENLVTLLITLAPSVPYRWK